MSDQQVVMFSGGISSWVVSKRVVARFGAEQTVLLFADTLIEDEDLYRFLVEGAANTLGGSPPPIPDIPAVEDIGDAAGFKLRKELIAELARSAMEAIPGLQWLIEGRSIWEVFHDERFLANHRVDPCSKILKRQLLDSWLEQNCDPAITQVAHGFDWSEGHRLDRMRKHDKVWRRWAPLMERPYLNKDQMCDYANAQGVRPPRLYELGFVHNNCGGGCVKAGQASWAHLLKTFPKRYEWWERNEEKMRRFLGKNVSILDDRRGGTRKPITLKYFRERLVAENDFDTSDWGSCGCFQTAES